MLVACREEGEGGGGGYRDLMSAFDYEVGCLLTRCRIWKGMQR